MMKMKYIFPLSIALALTACGDSTTSATTDEDSTTSTASTTSTTYVDSTQEIIEQSATESVTYQESEGNLKLVFSSSGLTVENDDNSCVEVFDAVATISCAGNYYLSGSSDDFQVVVAANADSAKVYLYLNNLELTSASDAPIYVQSADKVFFMLVDGTSNTLTDASTRAKTWSYIKNSETKVDTTGATIYAKDDITFKGNGTLTVVGNYNNGIHTSNDLRIKDVPTINVTAANHAIKGKGSVNIEGGYYTLKATSGDGIKSDEGEDEGVLTDGKGVVVITGGEFSITAGDDGIQSYNYILLADSVSTPKITVNATGKGIVSEYSIYVNAGIIDITASDDGIHSNMNINFNGGSSTISSGDDGVHADSTLRINAGSIYVSKAVEGFEGWYIIANGGKTAVVTSDDAWNAAGGSVNEGSTTSSGFGGPGGGATSSSVGYIEIYGGYHYLYAAGSDVDVLDANGTATITGGVVILEMASSGGSSFMMGAPGGNQGGTSGSGSCSTNMAGGLIDTDSGLKISGGVLLGFGNQTEEYPNCTATSYTAGTAYGSSAGAFAPSTSGSMIIYGGDISSVSTVDISSMTAVELPNGMYYYE